MVLAGALPLLLAPEARRVANIGFGTGMTALVLAETVDHFNWQLIGEVAKKATGADGKVLKEAYKEVEDQEDEHLYHSRGWLRELSLEGLGLKAQLPPPEEKQHARSLIAEARRLRHWHTLVLHKRTRGFHFPPSKR